MIDTSAIRDCFVALVPHLAEWGRRSFAAAEARSAGMAGSPPLPGPTGIAPSTIRRGLVELADGAKLPADRNRRAGGGRKALTTLGIGAPGCTPMPRAKHGAAAQSALPPMTQKGSSSASDYWSLRPSKSF